MVEFAVGWIGWGLVDTSSFFFGSHGRTFCHTIRYSSVMHRLQDSLCLGLTRQRGGGGVAVFEDAGTGRPGEGQREVLGVEKGDKLNILPMPKKPSSATS